MTGFLNLSTSMTLNDLEPPKEGVFVNFSRFRPGTHILRVNCTEMAELDLDNLRRGIAEAFVRFMSFAQITCIAWSTNFHGTVYWL